MKKKPDKTDKALDRLVRESRRNVQTAKSERRRTVREINRPTPRPKKLY